MIAKRIITTLMLQDGVLFRSKKFVPDHRYTLNFIDMWSIDEVIVIDITRNIDFEDNSKKNFINQLLAISKNAYVPITAGGGIKSLQHIETLLKNGSDKVLINSAALDNPKFIYEAAKEFGSQCIVISVDVLKDNNQYYVMENYGTKKSKYNLENYLDIIQNKNAGEIFIQSINMDGSLNGYDLGIVDSIKDHIRIPLIISGGAGNWSHVKEALKKDIVSAASLTNIFHFTEKSINNLKNFIEDEVYIRR